MKILLLNQTFHPDVMATGQYLSDLAVRLVERGHEVAVVTSRRAYDEPDRQFAKRETWRGVRIWRVFSTRFGKGAKWRRAADFASFIVGCCARLARLRRPDVVVALTTPPLISFVAAWYARLRGSRFVYWVMDFNPDEAVAAGWLRPDSLAGRTLEGMSRCSLRQADRIVVLDRFMRERVLAKGIAPDKVVVIPPWSQDDVVRFDAEGRERFRRAHGLADRFVVMYSGNHSPCHPLDTLRAAAEQLAGEKEIVFCFVGGGSEWRKIKANVQERRSEVAGREASIANRKSEIPEPSTLNPQPSTLLCLPYQPLGELSASLSAADLQVVVMGEPFVGLTHPCKIYNVLAVGAPVLYIGPPASHIAEVLAQLGGDGSCRWVRHGDVEGVVAHIRGAARVRARLNGGTWAATAAGFSRDRLLPLLIGELEQLADSRRV